MVLNLKKYAVLIAACSLVFASCATARDVPLALSSTIPAKPSAKSEPGLSKSGTAPQFKASAAFAAGTGQGVAGAGL